MNRVRIDFAPRTLRRAILRTRPLTRMLAAIGLILCVSAAITVSGVARERSALESQVDSVQAKLAARVATQPVPSKIVIPQIQANAVNQAILQLNLPWRAVLDAIEAATPAHIALLAIEPDANKQLVKGVAEAKSSEEMIAYVGQLKRQPFFDRVALTKHEINEQDPNKPLRFQFEAQWGQGPR